MMIHIAICDDDDDQLRNTKNIVEADTCIYENETDIFSAGDELINAVRRSDYRPDIAILDIDMPGRSGIETAEVLNALCPGCAVIFLTAFLSYATDVYETRHCYFVLKSQLKEKIGKAIRKAVDEISSEDRISFRVNGELTALPSSKVVSIERSLKKTIITETDGTVSTTYTKPDEMLAELHSSPIIKVHQSYYVNLDHVRTMNSGCFELDNGKTVPISRSRSKEAKVAFYSYIGAGLSEQ